jgi:hypothetical protein
MIYNRVLNFGKKSVDILDCGVFLRSMIFVWMLQKYCLLFMYLPKI